MAYDRNLEVGTVNTSPRKICYFLRLAVYYYQEMASKEEV